MRSLIIPWSFDGLKLENDVHCETTVCTIHSYARTVSFTLLCTIRMYTVHTKHVPIFVFILVLRLTLYTSVHFIKSSHIHLFVLLDILSIIHTPLLVSATTVVGEGLRELGTECCPVLLWHVAKLREGSGSTPLKPRG
jgi:hypothetical protein